ncbi:trypsin alpha-3-like protein, partial [Leptotrombidium deliense]
CGVENAKKPIIDATTVSDAKYPWLAFVLVKEPNGSFTECAGAIINDKYILTAAHCTEKLQSAEGIHVGVGSNYDAYKNQKILLKVSEFMKHPKYDHNDE